MPPKQQQPVFFDPEKRRWKRFSFTSEIIGLFFLIIFCALVVSLFITPTMPAISLGPMQFFQQAEDPAQINQITPAPTAGNQTVVSKPTPTARVIHSAAQNASINQGFAKHHGKHHSPKNDIPRKYNTATGTPPTTPTVTPTPPAEVADESPTATPQIFGQATPAAPAHSEVIGFFVNWDDNSLVSLKQNINGIDKLIPEWLHLADSNGNIAPDDLEVQQQVLATIKELRPNLPIMVLVNNYNKATDAWDSRLLVDMLKDPTARERNIQALLDYVQTNHFQGISVDFENVPPESSAELTVYMTELYSKFHPLGLEVSESVPVDDEAFNYPALASVNDYLILMAYDEHWAESASGPVASQQMFANALNLQFASVDPSKYVIGIGNYGYDWIARSNRGVDVSFEDAIRTAQNYKSKVSLDPVALNPKYDYMDESGKLHHVWFLDAVTAFDQLAEAHRYPIRGIALWRMGSEDPSIWHVFANRDNLDARAANRIQNLRFGDHLYYQGSGEILKVSSTPHSGQRSLNYDRNLGLITSETYTYYPSSYVIDRWGASDHKIALTFDDGPDPRWTPQILDVLKQKDAVATFFVIGMNANSNPDILRQIVNQGNEVGNHSFTHPDVSAISQKQLVIELNATERLMESLLGRRTILFRPPYAEDVEPDTVDQARPLVLTSQMGYYTIGMKIDPHDYLMPGVDEIVNQVVTQVTSGNGNVILLHDSGGDRTQTIAALPRIIDALRERGYEFVPISDLMGLTSDLVMPEIAPHTSALSIVNSMGFTTTSAINRVMSILFILGIVLGILRFFVIVILAFIQHAKTRRVRYPANYRPSLDFIVPAYNEAKVIDKTIDTLLKSTYETANIIVVDDGSSDDTFARVKEMYKDHPQVEVFTKENGGKAAALNYGIAQSQAEIIMAMDADTVILPDAAEKLVRHFADPKVAAVAGNAKVGNRINLLTWWQALEYITGQNLDRRAFALLNCITVVPGAIGAWRRELVLKMGGFTSETLAEDADLTLTLLSEGYKIDYEEGAIALTEAPDTVKGFLKQRFRWMFGTFQAAWKHLGVLMNPKYGALGMVAIPNILVFQIFFPLISPLMDLAALTSIGQIIWERYQHPLHPAPDELTHLLVFYVLFLLFDFLTAFSAFVLEKHEDWSLIIWLFLQRFFYRQLMYYVAIKSVLTAISGSMVGWGKLERKATVSIKNEPHE